MQSTENAQRTAEQTAHDLRRRLAESEAGRKQLSLVVEQQRQQMEQLQKQFAITPASPVGTASQVIQPQPEQRRVETVKNGQATPQIAVTPVAQQDEVRLEWIQAWQQSATFERERALVKLMGDTGECRKNKLAQELAQQFAVGPHSGSVVRMMQHLAERGMISLQEVKGIARGRAPNILLLAGADLSGLTSDDYVESLIEGGVMTREQAEREHGLRRKG